MKADRPALLPALPLANFGRGSVLSARPAAPPTHPGRSSKVGRNVVLLGQATIFHIPPT